MRLSGRRVGYVLVASFVAGFAISAEAATKKSSESTDAKRQECFRQAQARAAAMGTATTMEKQADGLSTYRSCAFKSGIKP